jgi:hypothetical protein
MRKEQPRHLQLRQYQQSKLEELSKYLALSRNKYDPRQPPNYTVVTPYDPNIHHGSNFNGNGSKIIRVPSSQLPPNTKGFHDSTSNILVVANDISETEKSYVIEHEGGHALGAEGSFHGEIMADNYAIGKTGRNPYPFRLSYPVKRPA